MPCIYHAVPTDFRGTQLVPLNALSAREPDIYAREIAKYRSTPERRKLPATSIPILDCLWNDVIHCAPIHPHLLFREWARFRTTPPPEQDFFMIPMEHVADLPGVIMDPGKDGNRQFRSLDPVQYREITRLPPETSAWYEHLTARGKFGAYFVGIPHILILGTIETPDLPLIPWSSPIPE